MYISPEIVRKLLSELVDHMTVPSLSSYTRTEECSAVPDSVETFQKLNNQGKFLTKVLLVNV